MTGERIEGERTEPARKPLVTRGQVVAHRALVRMGESGALAGLSGAQVNLLRRALADTLDIALGATSVTR